MNELNFEDDRWKPSILDETLFESKMAQVKGNHFTYEEEQVRTDRLNQFIEDCMAGD